MPMAAADSTTTTLGVIPPTDHTEHKFYAVGASFQGNGHITQRAGTNFHFNHTGEGDWYS